MKNNTEQLTLPLPETQLEQIDRLSRRVFNLEQGYNAQRQLMKETHMRLAVYDDLTIHDIRAQLARSIAVDRVNNAKA